MPSIRPIFSNKKSNETVSSNSSNTFPGFIIENTSIAVDYWPKKQNSQITHSFLTHAHSDHIQNLDHLWNGQIIHCSEVTKKLMMDLKQIDERYFKSLDKNRTHILKLDDSESFNVTLIDANHCPGAVMFLFEGYFGCILVTGDFRYSPSMFTKSPLSEGKEIEICYLDNTYLHEKFERIPSREAALKEIITHIDECRKKASVNRKEPTELIFMIKLKILGKEDLIAELYKYFKEPIVLAEKRFKRYTETLDLDSTMFTTVPSKSSLIFVQDADLMSDPVIQNFLEFKDIILIEPTALQFNQKHPQSDSQIKIAYTDHSSNREIHEFVRSLRPKRIVPIVRQMLPGNIDTTNIESLKKFLSKKPLKKRIKEKFTLIMRSSSCVKKGGNLNLFQLTEKTSQQHFATPLMQRSKPQLNWYSGSNDKVDTSTPINTKSFDPPKHLTPIPRNVTIRRYRRTVPKKGVEYVETPKKLDKSSEIETDMEEVIDLDKSCDSKDTPHKVVKLRRLQNPYKINLVKV